MQLKDPTLKKGYRFGHWSRAYRAICGSICKAKSIKVVVMDFNKNRLNFAQSRLKADEIICPDKDFSPENLREVLNGDHQILFSMPPEIKLQWKTLFNYLCSGGKLIFVGLFIGEIQFHDPLFHKNEITLMATRNAHRKNSKNHSFDGAKKIDINQWITHL